MRRPAAILILMLLTSCRFYDVEKRAAANAVLQSVVYLQARAPLTQSAARRPATAPLRACRLIAQHARLFPACLAHPQLLRRDAKRTIELCRSILPGNDLRQLHNRILVVQRTHARKKLVRNVATRRGDGVCVFKYRSFFS